MDGDLVLFQPHQITIHERARGGRTRRVGFSVMERASPPATTYQETSSRYSTATSARERFEELVVRDVSARAFMALAARGDYDPQIHGDVGGSEPLTVTEHLELLAAGEVLARYYRHPAHAHRALQAGATWAQVAAATGRDEAQARREYREWAADEYRLWVDYDGEFGMDAAEYAAAIARADKAPDR
jgi:hypothetical protein